MDKTKQVHSNNKSLLQDLESLKQEGEQSRLRLEQIDRYAIKQAYGEALKRLIPYYSQRVMGESIVMDSLNEPGNLKSFLECMI